jgi:Rha family phage regulatory protein
MGRDGIGSLPALCVELKLRAETGTPVVNSRDVAEVFGKQHAHVLRDIEAILTNPDLDALKWFRPVSYVDAKGESRPSFDLTRDGFTLLVMGFVVETKMSSNLTLRARIPRILSETVQNLFPMAVCAGGGLATAG